MFPNYNAIKLEINVTDSNSKKIYIYHKCENKVLNNLMGNRKTMKITIYLELNNKNQFMSKSRHLVIALRKIYSFKSIYYKSKD